MEKDFVASEVIGQGLAYTIMGICIVFLILIIIMFVIKAMALISAAPETKKSQAAPAVTGASAPAAQASQPPAEAQEDELELIAVITAAVAASLDTSPADIYVKSYKRVDGGAWNKAGRREVLQNRF